MLQDNCVIPAQELQTNAVIPANAGIYFDFELIRSSPEKWIPAFAGMTGFGHALTGMTGVAMLSRE